jgi:hypothetical protein
MITAALDDGPLRGMCIEAQVIDGRRPSTVDVLVDDGQHVPLLSRGLDPERSVRGVHVSLPGVDGPLTGTALRSRGPLPRATGLVSSGPARTRTWI